MKEMNVIESVNLIRSSNSVVPTVISTFDFYQCIQYDNILAVLLFFLNMNAYSPNFAIRQIHDQYIRKFRKRRESRSLEEEVYFNSSNIWRSSSTEEEKLHQAIRKSELFSQNRIRTFVRFNYRSIETRPICYGAVHQKLLSREKQGDKINYKGTMHVSELWCEKNLQDVLGSIAYPKDRLKILNQYQKQKKIRIRKQNSRGFREEKENIFN